MNAADLVDHRIDRSAADGSAADNSAFDVERAAVLARNGDLSLIAYAAGHLDDVDRKGDSLLMLAAYHGHAELTAALLQHGARNQRNARGLSAFDGAAFKGDVAVVDAFVAAGVDVDAAGADGRTPLMWAASFNRVAAVERLLAAGAHAAVVDNAGRAAVDHAAALGADDAVTVLVAATRSA